MFGMFVARKLKPNFVYPKKDLCFQKRFGMISVDFGVLGARDLT